MTTDDATPEREFPLVEETDADKLEAAGLPDRDEVTHVDLETDADRIEAAGLPDVGTGPEGHMDLETDAEKIEAAGLPHGRHLEDEAEARETEAERIDADRLDVDRRTERRD